MIIHKIYKFIIPYNLRYIIWTIIQKNRKAKIKKEILNHYSHNNPGRNLYAKEIEYLEKNDLAVIPHLKVQSHINHFKVYKDKANGLKYVIFENKKIYFKRGMKTIEIKSYFEELMKEQHIDSPHRYLSDNFNIENGSVVADVGVAEGIFSLSIIEHISHVYLFDPDPEWIEALEYTFLPWKSKVKIISKFVSDVTGPDSVSLDDFFSDGNLRIDFLKIDVDGAELKLLNGAKKILRTHNKLKIAICTYHNQGDERLFSEILQNNNFDYYSTEGHMLFYFDNNFEPPYFRKGLLRASKFEII